MRIAACFSIIILHMLFASTVYFEDVMSSGDALFERVAEHLLMWGVPLFLMISGALLLDPEKELTAKKLVRYLKRIVIALCCFTLIFQILMYVFEGAENVISGWLDNLIHGTSWAHMWYLYLMIAVYLMLPLYKAVTKHLSKSWQEYLIVMLLVFTSIIPVLRDLGIVDLGAFAVPVSTVYPAYLFIGYYLYHNRMSKLISGILLVACSGIIVIGTVFTDDFSVMSGYASILVVGQTAGLFGLMLNIGADPGKLILDVDKCTFGIYLIHMIGVRGIMRWAGFNPYEYGPLSFLLIAIVLFIVSYAISTLLRKIPKLNLL